MQKFQYYGQPHAQEVIDLMSDIANHPDKYQVQGVHLPKGILLIGAPGMGKTLFAHVLAEKLNKELIIIKPSSTMLSEEIETKFAFARQNSNYLILVDELFAMINKDEKTEGQLLAELDSVSNILVIATTSADEYDISHHEALTRPGRFDIKINLGSPSHEDRVRFFADQFTQDSLDCDFDRLADLTADESYAFLSSLVNQVKLYSLYQNVKITNDFVFWCKEKLSGFATEVKVVTFDELYPVAIHEVGHAIYGLFSGRQVATIEVSASGRRARTTFDDFVSQRSVNAGFTEIAIQMAGYAACFVVLKNHMIGAQLDFEEMRGQFYAVYRNSLVLHQQTATTFVHSGESEMFTKHYRRMYLKTVRKTFSHDCVVLKPYKTILDSYARLLMKQGNLSKKDLEQLKTDLFRSKDYPRTIKQIHRQKNCIIY